MGGEAEEEEEMAEVEADVAVAAAADIPPVPLMAEAGEGDVNDFSLVAASSTTPTGTAFVGLERGVCEGGKQ